VGQFLITDPSFTQIALDGLDVAHDGPATAGAEGRGIFVFKRQAEDIEALDEGIRGAARCAPSGHGSWWLPRAKRSVPSPPPSSSVALIKIAKNLTARE
jgi:hypothetical protein